MNAAEALPIEVFYHTVLSWPYRNGGRLVVRSEVDGENIVMTIRLGAVRDGYRLDDLKGMVHSWFHNREHTIADEITHTPGLPDRLSLCVTIPMIPPPSPAGDDEDDTGVRLGKPPDLKAGGPPNLKPVERDILALVASQNRRLALAELYAAFGPGREPEYGESTISHALAEMTKRRGLLTNKSDGYGKGYGLPGWS